MTHDEARAELKSVFGEDKRTQEYAWLCGFFLRNGYRRISQIPEADLSAFVEKCFKQYFERTQ